MQPTKPVKRFAGCAGTITGSDPNSFEERIARSRVSAAYDFFKANPAAAPEFTTITKTITLKVPANQDAAKLAAEIYRAGMQLPLEHFEAIVEAAAYAAKIGWQKYQDELHRNAPKPRAPIRIGTELLNLYKKLHHENF